MFRETALCVPLDICVKCFPPLHNTLLSNFPCCCSPSPSLYRSLSLSVQVCVCVCVMCMAACVCVCVCVCVMCMAACVCVCVCVCLSDMWGAWGPRLAGVLAHAVYLRQRVTGWLAC